MNTAIGTFYVFTHFVETGGTTSWISLPDEILPDDWGEDDERRYPSFDLLEHLKEGIANHANKDGEIDHRIPVVVREFCQHLINYADSFKPTKFRE